VIDEIAAGELRWLVLNRTPETVSRAAHDRFNFDTH
jgi:hypothetical protein